MPDLTTLSYDALYCLLKGEPGLRKSTCALSFPKPQYWFSWDMKMKALGIPMKAWGVDPSQVKYDDYTDWNAGLAKLRQLQVTCPFRTIVIDSITSAADAINRQTLKIKGATRDTSKQIAGIPVNSIEDFNAEESALKELVALTKDINAFHKVNIVLIAHIIQKEMKSANGQTHMSRILLTAGKGIAQKIPAYCEEVYHFNIEGNVDTTKSGQYTLLTTHTGDDFARTALPLPEKIAFGSDPLYDKYLLPAIQKMQPTKQTGVVQNATSSVQQA